MEWRHHQEASENPSEARPHSGATDDATADTTGGRATPDDAAQEETQLKRMKITESMLQKYGYTGGTKLQAWLRSMEKLVGNA